jgi:hypothetical protein
MATETIRISLDTQDLERILAEATEQMEEMIRQPKPSILSTMLVGSCVVAGSTRRRLTRRSLLGLRG